MLKIVKVGSVLVGVGVLVGLGVAGWMYYTRPDEVANSNGGTLQLDSGSTPSSVNSGELKLEVASPQKIAASGGNAGSLLGNSTAPAGSAEPTSTPTPVSAARSVPGPEEFEAYEQYHTSPAAMFGELAVGTGAEVVAGSKVTVHYRGWLTDGRLFDESYSGSKPYQFTQGAGQVIPGWEQGLNGMKVGGKRRVIVPPSQGYGAAGRPPVIPGDALLVFDVELVAVQ